jgi:hypothetical protein
MCDLQRPRLTHCYRCCLANDRVTRKRYIKPPTIEAIAAMRRFSETFSALEKPKLLSSCSPEARKDVKGTTVASCVQ